MSETTISTPFPTRRRRGAPTLWRTIGGLFSAVEPLLGSLPRSCVAHPHINVRHLRPLLEGGGVVVVVVVTLLCCRRVKPRCRSAVVGASLSSGGAVAQPEETEGEIRGFPSIFRSFCWIYVRGVFFMDVTQTEPGSRLLYLALTALF